MGDGKNMFSSKMATRRGLEMSPVKYLAVGDSLTEGVGTSPERCFVAQFFQHLCYSDQCFVRNWGISGMTTAELQELLHTSSMRRLLPQATLITVTTGGCDFIQTYENGLSLSSLYWTINQVRRRVDRILSLIRSCNPEAEICLLGFYIPLPAYEQGFTLASRVLQSMNQDYQRLCEQHKVRFINPFDIFLDRKDFFADEVHPNQKGHDALARLFIDHFSESAPPPDVQAEAPLIKGDESASSPSPAPS